MKILITVPGIVGIKPGLSGGEMRLFELIKCWKLAGHQIHILTSIGGKNLCEDLGIEADQYFIVSHSADDTRFAFILRAIKILFYSIKHLCLNSYDFIYSPSEQVYDVIPCWKMKLSMGDKIKWAVVTHWLPPFPPWKRKSSSFINSTLFFISERIGVRLAYQSADKLLPVSNGTLQQLQDVLGVNKKFVSVDCGVNLSQIKTITTNTGLKKYDAVFMKRLQAVKGIFDLINIWEIVVQHQNNAKLAIIGSGPDRERAQNLVKEKGLQNNIEFLGVIYDLKEKYGIIGSSKMFLLPTYEENWAIVIGEAMAAGVPVIAYDLPELLTVWKDNFIPIPVGNHQVFAREIISLLNSPSTQENYKEKGLSFIEKYDWKRIADNEIKIIMDSEQA